MSEKFTLKWNDFQNNVSQSFETLRKEKDFFDVTLISDDQLQVPAHKLVLAACSPFFKLILKNNSHSHPLLYLSDIKSNILKSVLDFIYIGEVSIDQNYLEQFLFASQKLKLKGLLLTEEDNNVTNNYANNKHFGNEEANLINNESFPTDRSVNDDFLEEKAGIFENTLVPVAVAPSSFESISEDFKLRTTNAKPRSPLDEKIENMIVKDPQSRKYICNVCQKISGDKTHAIYHAETHFENLTYKCHFCEKISKTRNGLRQHLNTNHKNENSSPMMYQ